MGGIGGPPAANRGEPRDRVQCRNSRARLHPRSKRAELSSTRLLMFASAPSGPVFVLVLLVKELTRARSDFREG